MNIGPYPEPGRIMSEAASAAAIAELRALPPLQAPPKTEKPVDSMTLLEVTNMACGALPPGFVLSLRMESGAAWVELSGPDGDKQDAALCPDDTLAMQIKMAVFHARGH